MVTVTATAAVNRFGLGARADELLRVGADSRGWLHAQLKPGVVDALDGLPASADYLSDYDALRQIRSETNKETQNSPRMMLSNSAARCQNSAPFGAGYCEN